MTGRPGEPPVAGDQRHSERLGKRNVDRIISREVVSQVPDARQQETVRMPGQRKSRKNRKSRAAAFAVNLAADRIAPDGVRDLYIDQMRGMQRLAIPEQPAFDVACRRGLEENLDEGRGVNDDHSRSQSPPMTSAGDGERVTGGSLCRRARSSSTVGRSALWRISRSRYSESDMPASAARDLSWRCRPSGTCRIWIITPMLLTGAHVHYMSNCSVPQRHYPSH